MNIKEMSSTFKTVFSKKSYFFLGIILAIIFYILVVFFSNFKNMIAIDQASGFFHMIAVIPLFMTSYPVFFTYKFFIGLVLISLLFGVLFSLIIYKTRMLEDFSGKTGFIASVGIFLGILAPGCSACGIGILSLLGISSAAIYFLPFKGLGLVALSILIMGFSIYKVTDGINKGIVCEVPVKK